MYSYIYDSFLTDKKHETELMKIEARLLELGLQGRIERLTILKNLAEVIRDAVKKGCKTLVVVGNDQTVSHVVSLIGEIDLTLGIIPMGAPNRIAELFGIPAGLPACDVLSRRIVERLDLGRAGNTFFLSSLEVPTHVPIELDCDGQYTVRLKGANAIRVVNVGPAASGAFADPRDGILDTVIEPKETGGFFRAMFPRSARLPSRFPIRSVRIRSREESVAAVADGQTVVKTPVTVEVVPRRLKVVVGKSRKLATES